MYGEKKYFKSIIFMLICGLFMLYISKFLRYLKGQNLHKILNKLNPRMFANFTSSILKKKALGTSFGAFSSLIQYNLPLYVNKYL